MSDSIRSVELAIWKLLERLIVQLFMPRHGHLIDPTAIIGAHE